MDHMTIQPISVNQAASPSSPPLSGEEVEGDRLEGVQDLVPIHPFFCFRTSVTFHVVKNKTVLTGSEIIR